MKPSNDREARIVAQQEIDMYKINEKHLMNQNAEHKRKISPMVTDEFNLKKEKKKADLKCTVQNPTRAFQIMREKLHKSKVENRHLKGDVASVKKVSDENAVFYKGKYLEYKNKFGVEKSLRQEKEKEAEHFGNHSKENRRLNMLVEKLSHDVEELTGHKNFSIKKNEELGQVIRKKKKDMAAVEKDAKNSNESAFKYKLNCETLKPYCGKVKVLTKECERLSEEQKKQRRQDDVNNSTIQDLKKTVVHLENKYANQEVDMEIVREENRVLIKAAETHEEETKHMEFEVKKMRDLEIKLQNQERKTKHATDAHFQEIIKLRAVNVELEKKLTQTITHADRVEAERNLLLQNQERMLKHATDAHFQEIIKLRAVNVELEKTLTQTITHADRVEAERNLLLQNQERMLKHATDAHFQEIIKLKAVNVELEKTLTQTITHADRVEAERNLLLQNQERMLKHAADAQFQEIITLRAVNVELEKKLTQTITHADGVVAERNILLRKQREDKAQQSKLKEMIDQKDKKLQDKTCEAKVQKVQMARLIETLEKELQKKMRDLEIKLQHQERKTKHATDPHFQEIIKLRAINVELEKKLTQAITHADGVVAERNLLLRKQQSKLKEIIDQKDKKLQDKTCEAKVQKEQMARLIETLEKELQTRGDMEVQLQLKLNQARSSQDADRLTIEELEFYKKFMDDYIKKHEEFFIPRITGFLKNFNSLELHQFGFLHTCQCKEQIVSLGVYQPENDILKEENQRVENTLKMDNLKTEEKLRNSGSGDMNQLPPLPPISQNPRSPAEETARDQAVSGYKPQPNRVLIKSKCLPKILKTVPLPSIGTVKLLPHPPPKPPQHPAPRRRR
ncbi:hypothetical protein OYC64_005085 [Pagothenia borchgrevinki]|uniref:Uncharacterized protein n=1 Tax=Pagothenia borchgrevinki TaxID=8213 RepID=A0ABD2GEP5_PAGBO